VYTGRHIAQVVHGMYVTVATITPGDEGGIQVKRRETEGGRE